MRKRNFMRMLVIICGLLVVGCEKETLPTEVSTTDQGFEQSIQTTQPTQVFRENFHLPVEFTAFSQCAGEELHFTGAFHWNSVTVIDAQGGFHSVFIANDHSLIGVGLTSGIIYHEVGAFTVVFNAQGTAPQEGTITVTLNYIGQGPRNNAINRENFHYTVNANGTTTVAFDNATMIRCQ
jgi:hypothetical protein